MRLAIFAVLGVSAFGQELPSNALDKYKNPGRGKMFSELATAARTAPKLLARLLTPPPAAGSTCAHVRIVPPSADFVSKMPLIPADPEIDPKMRVGTAPVCGDNRR